MKRYTQEFRRIQQAIANKHNALQIEIDKCTDPVERVRLIEAQKRCALEMESNHIDYNNAPELTRWQKFIKFITGK